MKDVAKKRMESSLKKTSVRDRNGKDDKGEGDMKIVEDQLTDIVDKTSVQYGTDDNARIFKINGDHCANFIGKLKDLDIPLRGASK